MYTGDIRALVFDVFGTVVDYRSTIIYEGEHLNSEKNLHVDWASFADAWYSRYRPSIERVMRGEVTRHGMRGWPRKERGGGTTPVLA